MGLLQSHLATVHYTECSRELASPILPAKRDLSSTEGMLLSVCSFAGSTGTSSGISARLNSQISAQFRRELVQIKSGAFGFLRKNGSQE
jgi:hypothetical protein